ncbi:MAG: hypothetical protein KAS93_01050, partial [Gammaproteobacteria bacterium]|nr:hypothetical protein [Gammaproteobacteria bacterium]
PNDPNGETAFLNRTITNEILPLLEILIYIRIINLGKKARESDTECGNDIMHIYALANSDVIEPGAKANYIAAIDTLLRKELPDTYAETIQATKHLLSPPETTDQDRPYDKPTHSDIPRIYITEVIDGQIDNDEEKKTLFSLAADRDYDQLQQKLLNLAIKVFSSDHFFNRPVLYRLINAKNKDGDTIAHIVAQDELSDPMLLTLAQLKSAGATFETTNAEHESVNDVLAAKDGLHNKLDTLHNEIDELEIVLQRCPYAMTEKANCADKLSRMRLINDVLPEDEQNERYKKLQQLRELLHNYQLNPNDIEKTTTKIKTFLPNINRQRILALILRIIGTSDNNQLFIQMLNDFADRKNELFTIDPITINASTGTFLQIATATNNKVATLTILEKLNSWHNLPNIFDLCDAPDDTMDISDNRTRCAYINYYTKDLPSAPYLAAEFGDMEIIKALLENNATQDLGTYSHYLALAIRSGDVVKLLYLLGKAKEKGFLEQLKNNNLLSSEIKQIPDLLTRKYITKVLAVHGIGSDKKQDKSAIHIEHKENAPIALIANEINCTELIMEAIEEAKVHLSITKRTHKKEIQEEIDNFTAALTRTLPQLVLEQNYTKKSHGAKLTIAARKVVMQYIERTERHKQPKTHKTNSAFQFTEYKIAQIKTFQAAGFKRQVIEQIILDEEKSLPTVEQFLKKLEGIDAMLKSEITRLKLATWEKEKPEESIYAMFMSFASIIDTLNNFKASFDDIKNTLRRSANNPSNEELENILAAKRIMIREQLPFTEEQLHRINNQIATSLTNLSNDPQYKDTRKLAEKRLTIIATELDYAADEETANEIQRELFNIEEEQPVLTESEISAAADETPNIISDTTPLIASSILDDTPEQTNPTHSSIATFFKTTAVNQADNARITASLFWNTLIYVLPFMHKQPTDTQIDFVDAVGPQS